MTTVGPTGISPTAVHPPNHPQRPGAPSGRPNELHLLRLALEHQLEALFLAVQAAAENGARPASDSRHIPWSRWLVEDLFVARGLASAALGAGPPKPDSGAVPGSDLQSTLLALCDHYQAIATLMAEVLDGRVTGHVHAVCVRVRASSRARLIDLHHHQQDDTPIVPAASSWANLPGELLG